MMMTLDEIKKRGFKDCSGYSLQYTYGWSHYYEFRLKKNGSSVYMEERISDKATDGSYSSVQSSFSKIKEWSDNVPVGLNNVPHKATMVIKMSDGTIYSFTHKMIFTRLEEGEIDIDSLVDTVEPQKTEEPKEEPKQPTEEKIKAEAERRRAEEEAEVERRRAEEEQRRAEEEAKAERRRAEMEQKMANNKSRFENKEEKEPKDSSNISKFERFVLYAWGGISFIIPIAIVIAIMWFCFSCLSTCGSSLSDWANTKTEVQVAQGEEYKISNDNLNFDGEMKVINVSSNYIVFQYGSEQYILGDKESGYGSFLIMYNGLPTVVDVYDVASYASDVLMIYSGNATVKSGHLANNKVVQSKSHVTKFLKKEGE